MNLNKRKILSEIKLTAYPSQPVIDKHLAIKLKNLEDAIKSKPSNTLANLEPNKSHSMKKSEIWRECSSKQRYHLYGKNKDRIFDPSKGGRGIKLNRARERFKK